MSIRSRLRLLVIVLLVANFILLTSGSNETGTTTTTSEGGGNPAEAERSPSASNEEEEEEEPSFIGLFSGLLETLTETKEVKDCPGQCVHTFRALICEATLENSACPGSMKCCLEQSSNETETNQHPTPHRPPPPQPPHWNNKPNWHYNYGPPYPPPGQGQGGQPPPRGPYHNGPPPQHWQNQGPPPNWNPGPNSNIPVADFQPIPTSQEENVTKIHVYPEVQAKQPEVKVEDLAKKEPINQEEDDEVEMEIVPVVTPKIQLIQDRTTETPPPKQSQICPGVCVAQRMIIHCDAMLNLPLCSKDLKCCVTQEYYYTHFKTNPNLSLVKGNETSEFAGPMQDDELDEADAVFSPVVASTIPPPRPLPPPAPKPPNNNCPGTCVNPLLTFFCNRVNNNYHCGNDNVCCMNGTEEGQPSPLEKPVRGQPPPQHMSDTDNCPRVCLPNNLYSKCPKVLGQFKCIEGYFCCVTPPHNAYPIHPGTGQPLYPPGPPPQAPSGPDRHGSGKPSRPPGPHREKGSQYNRHNSTMVEKSTTPKITVQHQDDEMDYEEDGEQEVSNESLERNEKLQINCPGSCINTILSFTCFRNAEITDIFLCNKPNTKCCAPKTAIKEYLDSINVTTPAPVTLNNQAEKVLKPHITNKSPAGHPQHSHYNPASPQNVYPQQNLIHPPPPNIIPQQMPSIPQIQQVPSPQNQPPPPNTIPIPANYQPVNSNPIPSSMLQPGIPLPNQPSSQSQNPVVVLPQIKPHFNKIPNFNKYVCGIKGNGMEGQQHPGSSRVKRVVGGEDSEPGEWCWQIALINNLNQYLCGGALIGTQWVLTAAHCVTNIIRSGDTIYVRVGDYDLTSKYGSPGAQTLRVQTTYIHHNHNSQTLDNDIALLKLQGQINLKEGVCLVCLPARSGSNNELYNSNKRCTVTGYGYMGESGPIPLRIREANLPIVPESECISKINAVTEKIFVLPTSSFCAGGELRNDACQGDGGGPLVCMDNGFYELTGLVSWGFGCGRANVPGVYVKVSSFVGWINQIISVNN